LYERQASTSFCVITSIMLPKNRPPTAPGEILLEEFLRPSGMTQTALAEKLDVFPTVVSGIVTGKRAISAEMAIKFARALETSPQFWMSLQSNLDLWNAERRLAKERRTA
jgi:addiction module HigA family antidote